jgi:hypothetical protein
LVHFDGAITFWALAHQKATPFIALFRVINGYVGSLPSMPGGFPHYRAPVIRNTDSGREMATMR